MDAGAGTVHYVQVLQNIGFFKTLDTKRTALPTWNRSSIPLPLSLCAAYAVLCHCLLFVSTILPVTHNAKGTRAASACGRVRVQPSQR